MIYGSDDLQSSVFPAMKNGPGSCWEFFFQSTVIFANDISVHHILLLIFSDLETKLPQWGLPFFIASPTTASGEQIQRS
jgi:hypothetical protein